MHEALQVRPWRRYLTWRRLLAISSATALWALAAIVWQGSAVANNWGGNIQHDCDSSIDAQCVAFRGTMLYWFNSNLHHSKKDAVRWAATNQFTNHPNSHSKIRIDEVNSKSASHIRIRQANGGLNGAWAWGYCPDSSDDGSFGSKKKWCEPQLIVWNQDYSQFFDTDNKKKALACHELGHVYGLRHRSGSSCMRLAPTGANRTIVKHDMRCLKLFYPLSNNGRLEPDEPPNGQNCP